MKYGNNITIRDGDIKVNKEKKKETKLECHICGQELSEDDVICPNCGAYQDESCYDIEDDLE
jgi:rubrerythrin